MANGTNRKFGRHKRAASNANQVLRTARNKRRRIEREAQRLAVGPKKLNKPRGTARWIRRGAKPRTEV